MKDEIQVYADVPEILKDTPQIFLTEAGRLGRLNPLYEAYLIERLQFDGDIPELRTAPAREGGKAAIPVLTEARNPSLIGQGLNQAALQVEGSHSLQHVTYGSIPTPVKIESHELAPMDRELSWACLSTTQGRRSAIPPIVQGLLSKYPSLIYKAERINPLACVLLCEWTMSMEQKPSAHFSYVENAIAVLSAKLKRHIEDKPMVLKVQTVDRISERVVGWKVALETL